MLGYLNFKEVLPLGLFIFVLLAQYFGIILKCIYYYKFHIWKNTFSCDETKKNIGSSSKSCCNKMKCSLQEENSTSILHIQDQDANEADEKSSNGLSSPEVREEPETEANHEPDLPTINKDDGLPCIDLPSKHINTFSDSNPDDLEKASYTNQKYGTLQTDHDGEGEHLVLCNTKKAPEKQNCSRPQVEEIRKSTDSKESEMSQPVNSKDSEDESLKSLLPQTSIVKIHGDIDTGGPSTQ
jgi:hypothetical protein